LNQSIETHSRRLPRQAEARHQSCHRSRSGRWPVLATSRRSPFARSLRTT